MNNNKPNKQCTSCMDYLPESDFYRSTNGLYSKCKSCIIAYNSAYRDRNRGIRRVKKTPLLEINRRILSLLDRKKSSLLEIKNLNSRIQGEIILFPHGMIMNGELSWGELDNDDVLHILSSSNIKILDVSNHNLSDEDVRGKVLSLRNSRREPISALRIRGLVSQCQYYLWMDSPRKLLISEVADLLALPIDIVEFIVSPEKKEQGTLFEPPPKNIEISTTNEPQVYEFTEE